MAIQLEDFAKQVLFGTTIEEKLRFPREEIVDTRRGDPIRTPRKLSRPSHLQLREDGVKASHPAEGRLVDEKERGRLLHFFGNHELLATELMALAILKFPDAPASFRRGLLETLKDEQVHTQMYMHRMKQCGVEFGELPLNDYFWKSVSSMEDPLDYVTRLSLTFEQANLDYSREYGKIFDQVGDASTAAILDKIYRDEIDHVGFGLKWFRRWKAEGKTDWEAFRERLVFPLSPARAKGNFFNKGGRSEAGLDDGFIEQLEVFSQSRGRTPHVYWFNPDAERFAAADSDASFDGELSMVQRDLGFLPAYLSRKDDVLIVGEPPSAEFLRKTQLAGFELPEVIAGGEKKGASAPALDRKIGSLRPWAWTPDSLAFFGSTMKSLTRPRARDEVWNAKIRDLFSKAWSADWASRLPLVEEEFDWVAPAEIYGRLCRSIEEIAFARSRFAELGYGEIACKAPFGTAANGMRCLREEDVIEGRIRAWLETALAEQGGLVVEPWLERVFDFSVQLELREGALKVLGFTRLLNNARGQFKGIVTDAFSSGLESELKRFLLRRVGGVPRVYSWFEECLSPVLEEQLNKVGYLGPLGIDAFVYRSAQGELRLKPVVEINPRYTMGRVALEVGQRNAATSVGYFQILNRQQLKKSKGVSFSEYCDSLERDYPLQFSTEKKARIKCGSFPLVDPHQAKRFLAVYHVRESFSELPL
ncbi:DUF455 family protein [Pelagicoccus mobilis]|uniref:DUF455 family protein n=1 Tax=Pelagicoccus mobilis TaxID=415221 RepID=A0A934RW55_9BACT|nr:DUF455 family protein [Pelagicoccus mobilis]MBK1876570.1 DUF455 family protein [Pelagicoccus mobilis]